MNLMFLNNSSIRRKLIFASVFASASALLVGISVTTINDSRRRQADFEKQAKLEIELIADYCVPALLFKDPKGAHDILMKLENIPNVHLGILYDYDGARFAVYQDSLKRGPTHYAEYMQPGKFSVDGEFIVVESITHQEEHFGTIVLVLNTEELSQDFKTLLTLRILVFIAVVTLTALLTFGLQHSISRPILNLAQVVGDISNSHDYSLRVEKSSNDEVGVLSDSFNQMLFQIEVQQQQKDLARKKLRKLNQDLEEMVKHRTQKLENANQELQDFAYIVSHDLKAPLRGINQLAHWISEDYKDVLDEPGLEKIDLLTGRVQRLDALIQGILQYSRIGRLKMNKDEIELDALINEIIESLAVPEHLIISLEGEFPVYTAEKTMVTQLFQNLLSNAIKHHDKPEGKIQVICSDQGNVWRFEVADDGPGIEEKYFDRIFKIFQTLKARDEKENTGIGLTLVRKIVDTLHGKVWVESIPNEGTSFFVEFPKQVED